MNRIMKGGIAVLTGTAAVAAAARHGTAAPRIDADHLAGKFRLAGDGIQQAAPPGPR